MNLTSDLRNTLTHLRTNWELHQNGFPINSRPLKHSIFLLSWYEVQISTCSSLSTEFVFNFQQKNITSFVSLIDCIKKKTRRRKLFDKPNLILFFKCITRSFLLQIFNRPKKIKLLPRLKLNKNPYLFLIFRNNHHKAVQKSYID